MSTVGLSYPKTSEVEYEEFVNIVLKNFKELDWLFGGKIDFKNIQADGITTKNLKAGSVVADKINVTELSAIAANLGTMTAGIIYGAYIATANGTYPRTEMSTVDNLFAAYQSATQFIKITPDASAGNPGLTYRNGSALGFLYQLTTDLLLATSAGSSNVQISSGKDLLLGANTGSGYKTKMDSFSTVVDNAGVSLQTKFDAKQNTITGASGTVYVASSSGGPATTPITFTNGIRTS